MIYGDDPTPLRREHDKTDIIGIRLLVLSRFWQPSRGNLSQAELDREAPPIPAVSAGSYLTDIDHRPDGGGIRTSWTFEGINGDGKSVTFKNRENSIDYRFEGGFVQLSLLLSARWPSLKEKFGGQTLDGRVIWPDTTPTPATTGVGTQNRDSGENNPMFGHDTFDDFNGTYFFRFAEPAGTYVPRQPGRIYTTGELPGNPPRFPDRNWRGAAPAMIRRGPVDDITEAYQLSQEGGWNEPIYGKAESAGGRGKGLSTGRLQTGTL